MDYETHILFPTQSDVGLRVDKVIELHTGISRSQLHRYWSFVLVNNKNVKKSYKVKPKDVIRVSIPKPTNEEIELVYQKASRNLEIIYEDEWIVVVNKPAGLVVHPAKGHPNNTLINYLLDKVESEAVLNGVLRPGLVHRLDKDTSGIILITKNLKSQQAFTTMFKSRQIKKIYLALVKGHPHALFKVEGYIKRDPKNRKRFKLFKEEEGGKYSLTLFKVITYFEDKALVEARPITGRTHQIRVHLASKGHPIVGDKIYSRKAEDYPTMFLHAYKLSFIHPFKNQKLSLTASPPSAWYPYLEYIKAF